MSPATALLAPNFGLYHFTILIPLLIINDDTTPMTEAFPDINLLALKKFAISAALVEHAHRTRSNGSAAQHATVGAARAGKSGKGKASSKSTKINPKVKSCKDGRWAGEKVGDLCVCADSNAERMGFCR